MNIEEAKERIEEFNMKIKKYQNDIITEYKRIYPQLKVPIVKGDTTISKKEDYLEIKHKDFDSVKIGSVKIGLNIESTYIPFLRENLNILSSITEDDLQKSEQSLISVQYVLGEYNRIINTIKVLNKSYIGLFYKVLNIPQKVRTLRITEKVYYSMNDELYIYNNGSNGINGSIIIINLNYTGESINFVSDALKEATEEKICEAFVKRIEAI